MTTFKIATFNIHHGKVKGVPYSTKKLCKDAKSLNVDVLCLQEVDSYSTRTHFVNQSKAIAKYLGFNYRSAFVRFYGIGFQYNTILSKYPILNYEEILLPSPKGEQRRVAQYVTIEIESTSVDLINCHLHSGHDNSDGNKIAQNQLEFLAEKYKNENILIAGDLNLTPEFVFPIINKTNLITNSEYLTSPAANPKHQIDWIITRGYEIEYMKVSTQLCSDHRALIADIKV